MTIALEIMGLGMLGIFTAMLVIMAVTMLLGKLDAASFPKKMAASANAARCKEVPQGCPSMKTCFCDKSVL